MKTERALSFLLKVGIDSAIASIVGAALISVINHLNLAHGETVPIAIGSSIGGIAGLGLGIIYQLCKRK